MKARPEHGVLVISVDVAGDSSPPQKAEAIGMCDARAVLDAAKWLLRTFDALGLPATWYLAGPGTSVLRSHVIAASVRHEIGLLAIDGGSQNHGRPVFARDLERRILASRAAGVEITSLATRMSGRVEHLDLLVKHGIRAVRHGVSVKGRDAGERFGWGAVSTLRYGISSLPATMIAVERPRWQLWLKAWEDRRQIATAAQRRQYCHLAIDVHLLAQPGSRKHLYGTLRSAARLFDGSHNRIETVSSLTESLMARPSAPRAQSILRAA